MSKFRTKLNRLLALVLSVCVLGSVPISAAGGCSLRVLVEDSAGDPVPDINVELIQVARGTGSSCVLLDEFADLDLTIGELLGDPSPERADQVFQYAFAKELYGEIRDTSDDGSVEFTGLEQGVYLVLDRGKQLVSFQPYLVVLPAEIGGRLENDVTCIPKTSETDTRTLMVIKLWNDNMDEAGGRPSHIDVTVLQDGLPIRQVTLSEDNDWQHMFYMLPVSGVYTVEEEPITDYTAEYFSVAEGYIILNTYTGSPGGGGGGGDDPNPPTPPPPPTPPDPPAPQKAHVAVRKVWADDHDAAGKRPGSVTVQLIEGGTVIKTASLSEANQWTHTFVDLEPDKSYTVQEIAVADYTAAYVGNASTGITVINTYSGETDPGVPPDPVIPDPEPVNIPVEVRWIDDNNASGKRPEAVTVYLIADGSIITSVRLGPNNSPNGPQLMAYTDSHGTGTTRAQTLSFHMTEAPRMLTSQSYVPDACWSGMFVGVPSDLSYTVWQPDVAEYTTSYSGNAAEGFVVTNVYTEGVTDPGMPPAPTPPVEPPNEGDVSDGEISEEELPGAPAGPTIPQTGAEVLPVYLLMAAGVLLVLLGILDLYLGRKKQ